MGISTKHYQPSMIRKIQFFFETMDSTPDCEMFLSDDCLKGTESSLKDEYISAMVLKNCWPTQNVEEAIFLHFCYTKIFIPSSPQRSVFQGW
jgi:hypothetical protein